MSQNTVTLANGNVVDVATIIAKPEDFGFAWEWEHLHHNGNRVTMGRGAPRKLHLDIAKCMSTFGDNFFLDSANGTSARVKDQTIRSELADNIPLRTDERAMCEWIVRNALGAKSRKSNVTIIEHTKYVGLDRVSYDTVIECQAANLAYLVDAGMAVADAKMMLGIEA